MRRAIKGLKAAAPPDDNPTPAEMARYQQVLGDTPGYNPHQPKEVIYLTLYGQDTPPTDDTRIH